MEQTGTNQCLVFVGSMENHVADRLEEYAKQNDMKVVETIFKDDRAIDKLSYYIEREGIICVLVRSIWDISTDRETLKSIMKLAAEHNVSINEENRGFEPATLYAYDIESVWDSYKYDKQIGNDGRNTGFFCGSCLLDFGRYFCGNRQNA